MTKNTLRKEMLKYAKEIARTKFIDDDFENGLSAKEKEIRAIQKVLNDNPDFSSREFKKMIEEQRMKDAQLEKSFLF